MNVAEQRSVVADLREVDATVDLIGRVRLDGGAGPVVAVVAGVHRGGLVVGGPASITLADARWFETVTEWFARSAA